MGLRGDGGGGGIDPEEEQGPLGHSMDFLLYSKGSLILLNCFDDRNGMVKCVCLKKKNDPGYSMEYESGGYKWMWGN